MVYAYPSKPTDYLHNKPAYQPYKRPYTPYIPTLHPHTYPTQLQPACMPAMPLTADTTTYLPHQLQRCYFAVQLRFASDRILSAAKFIGEIIACEFDSFVESLLKKGGMLKSFNNLQFWQIAQPSLSIYHSSIKCIHIHTLTEFALSYSDMLEARRSRLTFASLLLCKPRDKFARKAYIRF